MSPRHLFKRYLGDPQQARHSRAAGWLGQRIHDPEIWHFGRRSVAGAVGLGFFLALIPIPIQMLLAAPLCLVMRVNLPVTIAAVWVTNPITAAPIFIFAYKVGGWILGRDTTISALEFELSFAATVSMMGEIWQPLLLGCFVVGLSAAAIGNLTVRWIWRIYLLRRWRRRRLHSS